MAKGKKAVFDSIQEQAVVARFDSGLSAHSLAQEFDTRRSHIYSILKRFGRQPAKNAKTGPVENPAFDTQQIVALYQSGKTMRKIAAEIGASYQTVRNRLLKSGVDLREFGGVASQQEIDLYQSGKKCPEIAKIVGSNVEAVRRRLRKAGVHIQHGWNKGPTHPAWKGGKQVRHGYVLVWVSPEDPMRCMAHQDGYVLEHRLVMARHLGRPLAEAETVHHIDGDRSRNVIENLQLRQGKHGKHAKFQCQCCGSFDVVSVKLD